MKTVYYTLSARRVTAPGEDGSAARRYARLQGCAASPCGPHPEGKLLRLSDYRPLPAWEEEGTAAPVPQGEALPIDASAEREARIRALLGLLPDLCATAGLLIMAFVVTARFLALL